jgi:DNA (cytosine-5)-methyltransferase 1
MLGKGQMMPDKRRFPVVAFHAVSRRLTPRECERLQGWPDDWTRRGVLPDGREIELADGPRYRMAGNGVTATVSEWIGRRLVAAMERS